MSGDRKGEIAGTTQAQAPNVCFGCGEGNPGGMHLEFSRDHERRRVIGQFRLEERYQGAPGMAHGGIVALVLDEALSKVSKFYDVRAVTAELNVEYLKPVRVGEVIHVEAHQERAEGRNLFYVGEIRDGNGRVLARARGRFVVVDPEIFRRLNGVNLSRGEEEKWREREAGKITQSRRVEQSKTRGLRE